MEKIALITNYNIPEKAAAAQRVAEKLSEYVGEVLVPDNYKEKLMRTRRHQKIYCYRTYDEIYAEAELVIVIGGDGSMLECARRTAHSGAAVLGINMGRIGYMSELELSELELLDKVFRGEYYIDERSMLDVKIVGEKGNTRFRGKALNEAVVANGVAARIIDIELYDGEEQVCAYRADGLVVATPTGSTAYSLSAGGPIVDPRLSCICVTPVCPHSLLARPMIFPDASVLKIKNTCVREKVLHLTLDGRTTCEMYLGDAAVITKSDTSARLLRVKNAGFCTKMRLKKLV